ncbi:DEAH-box ATP-dependent RNA helicase prp43 [Pleurotus pulmonarius]|nr:DEAH-box ATP-dependent RNA helicase prp43 [Pleurotus pulmonarius]
MAGNSKSPDSSTTDPLHGFLPRKVSGAQARKALEHDLNAFTNPPTHHTARYKELLAYRKKLPVYAQMDDFFTVFNENQIVILAGEAGSGKTTQIPQFVAYSDLAHSRGKMIACTQPRRVAAKSTAERVAEEMDVQLGYQVGYSIRFENRTKRGTTFLKYMTDGMLLREAMSDHSLRQYSTIILDEVHERTLATDILMGLLKAVAKRRADLKIIIMSATLNAVKFQEYFSLGSETRAPLFKVPGRTHPIEIIYSQEPELNYVEAAIRFVLTIHRAEDPGDILLFLTGEDDIEMACREIKLEADHLIKQYPSSVGPIVCIPFYAALEPTQQQRVFDQTAPPAQGPDLPLGRKVVISTNIAETSLTINGIVYVVDPGYFKQKIYNPRTRHESLLVHPISKASAQQRTGRTGRTGPGKCFRLYTEEHFMSLEEETCPEILRSNLSNMVLQLVKLGIRVKDLAQFDYIDTPSPEALMRGVESLNYLEAIDDDETLTPLGSMMAEFPLDPQLASLLITSPQFECSEEIVTIASMLSVPRIWVRPADQKREADAAKELFTIPGSDHLTLLNVYNQYVENKSDEDWPQMNFVSGHALAEAEEVREQLQRLMGKFELELVSTTGTERKSRQSILRALVCGLFMQVARREGNSYRTIKEDQFAELHPSCQLNEGHEWVLFDEFIFTGRSYLRTVSEVSQEWLLELAPSYFDLRTFPDGLTKLALEAVTKPKAAAGEQSSHRMADRATPWSLYTMNDAIANLTGASTYTLEDAVADFIGTTPSNIAGAASKRKRALLVEQKKKIQQIRHQNANRATSSRLINPASLYTMEDAIANLTGTSAYSLEDAVSGFTNMTLQDYSLLFHR